MQAKGAGVRARDFTVGLEAAGDLRVCANSSESCGPGPHSCSTAGMALQEKVEGSHKLPQHKGLQATLAHVTSFIHCSEKGFEVVHRKWDGVPIPKERRPGEVARWLLSLCIPRLDTSADSKKHGGR